MAKPADRKFQTPFSTRCDGETQQSECSGASSIRLALLLSGSVAVPQVAAKQGYLMRWIQLHEQIVVSAELPHFRSIVCVLMCAVPLSFGGCGRGDIPELADVTGTVQMDGQPLANAAIKFVPTNGRPSSAITDSGGNYRMQYNEDAAGVLPGLCRVLISTGTATTENEDGEPVPGNPETVPAEYNVDTSRRDEWSTMIFPSSRTALSAGQCATDFWPSNFRSSSESSQSALRDKSAKLSVAALRPLNAGA